MNDGFWSRIYGKEAYRSYRSGWEGKVQPRCPLCGKQITNVASAEPYGKKGKLRHSKCKPPAANTPTKASPTVLRAIGRSSRKGRDAWRKRHRWALSLI